MIIGIIIDPKKEEKMIHLHNKLITWDQVEISKEPEVKAKKALQTFYAENTLTENVQRFVNGMAFFIAGAKLVSLLPAVTPALINWGAMAITSLGASSLLQNPTLLKVIPLATQMIVALAFIQVVRKILAVAIWHIVYPAVFFGRQDNERWEQFKSLANDNCDCRRIALNKSGIDYDAFAVEPASTKGNGKWVIVAGGNGWTGEDSLEYCVRDFRAHGFNTLFINGPGVGRSTGFPTSYSVGAGQEAGLQFLEKVVNAKTILLYGTSLGGGAQSEAIQNHSFKKEINYIVWSHVTFDKLSNVASSLVIGIAKYIFFLLGIEANGVKGAKRLQELGIRHIVTQHNRDNSFKDPFNDKGSDGVIHNRDSLYIGMRKADIVDQDRVKFYLSPDMDHNDDLPVKILQSLYGDISYFVANPLPIRFRC